MMATINSEGNRRCWQPRHDRQGGLAFTARLGCWCLSLIGLFAASWLGFSENTSIFAQRAEKHFQEARKKFQANTNDVEAAWQRQREGAKAVVTI